MKILHYTLGFAPYRSGGLVKYATDLMKEQGRKKNQVFALYPGQINILKKHAYIKKSRNKIVESYQIINSLPLPLFGGIKTPKDFMTTTSKKIYIDFLKSINPDVIHIHTLMGIHKEFFDVAIEMNIPIIFTSHDYFGLAPEPTFFFEGYSYDKTNTVNDWIKASKNSWTTNKLRLFQSRYYLLFKNIFNRIKKGNKNIRHINDRDFDYQINEYYDLKNYYKSIFSKITIFHFNSTLAKEIYIRNLRTIKQYRVITITNSQIRNRNNHKRNTKIKKIAYIGPDKEFKGFYEFIELAKIFKNNKKFEFHTYGYYPKNNIDNIIQNGKYSFNDLDYLYENIDLLIVPSKWKETFGMITIEALSYGTEVYISENVGSKELIDRSNWFTDVNDLANKILSNRSYDNKKTEIKNIDFHEKEIMDLYLEK
ncbi:glycosyltransferase [Enterococcus devriesei]|uniref:glycosyltransferase n=1 Tax=Enterococcus devriesei TaxID=319970 RepID=UPI0028EAAF08|nr:glycosyltransferase [Enterococcus devriesei]